MPSSGHMEGPAIYAGRLADDIDHDWVLDDRNIAAAGAIAALSNASALIVLDALSFPWELLSRLTQELPVYLVLPSNMTLEQVALIFAKPLADMTFCDRIVVADRALGRALARKHRWARCQWKVRNAPLAEIAGSLLTDLRMREPRRNDGLEPPSAGEELNYWRRRGSILAHMAPERAVCTARHSLRINKHMHRQQSRAIEHALQAARPIHADWRMIEIGCGVGRWVPDFLGYGGQYAGIDGSADAIAACRRNHPNVTAAVGDARGPLPVRDRSLDLAAFITVLHHLDDDGKRAALDHVWRALRPNGRLLILESFVGETQVTATTKPISWPAMQGLIVDATCNTAVLEHFETLTYRHIPATRAAVAVFSKLSDR